MPRYKKFLVKKITMKIYFFTILKKNNFVFLKKLYQLLNYVINDANNVLDVVKKINDDIYLLSFDENFKNEIEALIEIQIIFLKEIIKNEKI